MDRQIILQALRKNLNCNWPKLPKDIGFNLQGSVLTMELNPSAVGLSEKPANMQENAAAFEGWALALYAHLLDEKGTVLLKAPVFEDSASFDEKRGHHHRFLYRAMKFSEQFPWFQLAPELGKAIAQFRTFFNNTIFVNNVGKGLAGTNKHMEITIESLFSEKHSDLLRKIASDVHMPIGGNPICRQLSVGLFREKYVGKNGFFSGGSSAIDLWTCDGTTISIFELKVDNKMIGMVTELFFYANYVYDMFCDVNTFFQPQPPRNTKNDRGYSALLSSEGNKICQNVQAFFLYDDEKIHPLITDRVITLLNQGTEHIRYATLSYPLSSVLA